MRYLRLSALIGVDDEKMTFEELAEVASNDIRDVINGDLDPQDVPYGLMVSECEITGEETKS